MPSRCCASVNSTLKSALKSLPNEDAQGNVHPIRCLYACTFASGAREIAHSMTSWFARCVTTPLKPSAIDEQDGQPAGAVLQPSLHRSFRFRCDVVVGCREID